MESFLDSGHGAKRAAAEERRTPSTDASLSLQHPYWTITWETSNGPDGRDDQRIRRLLASLIARRLSDSQDAQRGSE